MNLTELQSEVYTQTNLPRLVNETLAAIRSATLKVHQRDYFYRDLKEVAIDLGTEDYVQSFEYRNLSPRWRALKYIRRALADGSVVAPSLDVISPENFMDSYNIARTNVAYVAGDYLQIKCAEKLRYAVLGFYQNPAITTVGYSSWIAEDHPYAIIHEAAAIIFASVGDDTQARNQKLLAVECYQAVVATNVQGIGY